MHGQNSARLLEHGNHLIATHAGEAREEVINAIAGFEMNEKAADGHAGAVEHALTPKDVGVGAGRIGGFHDWKIVANQRTTRAESSLQSAVDLVVRQLNSNRQTELQLA